MVRWSAIADAFDVCRDNDSLARVCSIRVAVYQLNTESRSARLAACGSASCSDSGVYSAAGSDVLWANTETLILMPYGTDGPQTCCKRNRRLLRLHTLH